MQHFNGFSRLINKIFSHAMKKIIIFLLSFLGICACSSDSQFNKRIYFELSYLNYAWGYVHQGWVIDQDGKVYSFRNPKQWNMPDEEGYIKHNDLNNNRLYCDSIINTVDSKSLNYFVSLIPSVAYKSVTDKKWTGCDAGVLSYCCYYYDPTKGKYKQIILKESGDYSRENTSQYAEAISNWMSTIQAR
jgi:hypothetical protein